MSSLTFADGVPLTADEIRQAAAAELKANRYYQDDELRSNWEGAYRYYKGEAPAPTEAHDSTVVSTDVSDTLEWILPAIIKPLVESPDVVRFDPVNPEDQDQADLESDYVHHTFMKKCNGFTKLYCHIKDALLLKNAVFATYWDEGVKNQKEEYRNLTEIELTDLMSPADGSTVTLVEAQEHEEPILDPMTGMPLPPPPPPPPQPDPQTGQPMAPPPPQPAPTQKLYDVTVRRFTPNGTIVVENCEPESFQVRMTHNSIDLDDARYCSYTVLKTKAELLSMGATEEQLENVTSGARRYWDNEVRWEREDVEREANSLDAERNETGDPSQDLIDVHRVYMMLDADGDGYEERHMILLMGTGGEALLDHYEVPENPFSASTPFIAAHKFYGYSLYDKVKALADHKTKVLRMLEDNLDLANNPRKKVLYGQANLDDVLAPDVVGAVWRMDTVDSVTEVPTPMITQQAYGLLEYLDKMRSERTGIDPNAQSISKVMPEESMNHAMERVLSMKEELVGLMIRVFAETGIRSMFIKLRNELLRNMDRAEMVQLRNKWTEVNPANWVERTNTTIVVGLGTGDRIKKLNALGQVYQMQKESIELGLMGRVVTPERMAYTQGEFIRAAGLGDPDDHWVDPALADPNNPNSMSPRGQEVQRALQMQQQQQQEAMQAEQQKVQAAQEAQMAQQQMLLQAQKEIAMLQQQGKMAEAQIKAQQQEKDRWAEIDQFMREQRFKWAELATKEDLEKTKVSASAATSMVQQGVALDAAERAEQASKEQSKDNGSGE